MGLWWNRNALPMVMVMGFLYSWLFCLSARRSGGDLPCQPVVKFRQYAEYVDVDLKNGRSLFYYFVEVQDDPDHKPLTLWLHGGPGCSSIGGGAFTELGPFFLQARPRPSNKLKSWNKASNLLFMESPAGVGWSYSNTSSDYTCGDASTGNENPIFLIYGSCRYACIGHYIPQLAVVLLDRAFY